MNKLLRKRTFIFCLLLFIDIITPQQLQAQPASLRDSIQKLLTVFYNASADDSKLQELIAKTRSLYIYDKAEDSVAANLMTVVKLVKEKMDVCMLMNFFPFREADIFSYTRLVLVYTEKVYPYKKSLYYASALHYAGWLYNVSEDIPKRKLCFDTAIAIRLQKLGRENIVYAESLIDQATLFYHYGHTQVALLKIQVALKIMKKSGIPDSIAYANCMMTAAAVYSKEQKYTIALNYFDSATAIWEKLALNRNPLYALYISKIALLNDEMSQYTIALARFRKAMDITEAAFGKNNMQYLWCLNGKSEMLYRLGQYEASLDNCKEILAICDNNKEMKFSSLPLFLSNTATTYIKMGEYSKALPLLQEALKVEESLDEKDPVSSTYFNFHLASLYIQIGQYDEALGVIRQSLYMMEVHHRTYDRVYSRLLMNMSVLCQKKNLYDSAIVYCSKAVKLSQTILGSNHRDYLNNLDELALLYMQSKQYVAAKKTLQQLLGKRKNLLTAAHPEYAKTLYSMSLLYDAIGRYDSASVLLRQSLEIQKKSLGERHPDYIKSLSSFALMQARAGKPTAAAQMLIRSNKATADHIKQTNASLSEAEKLNMVEENILQFSYLPSIAANAKSVDNVMLQQMYNDELFLKGLVLQEQRNVFATIKGSNDTATLHLYEQWRFNKAIIGKQILLPLKKQRNDLVAIMQETKELEQQLSASSYVFRNQQLNENITATKVSSKLNHNEAAIEFIRYRLFKTKWTNEYMYAALLILPADSIPKFIFLCSEHQLMDVLVTENNSKNTIQILYNPQLPHIAQLSNLIWKPLKKYIAGITTVYFAPAGMLNRIAFQALITNDKLVIEQFRLIQVLSTRSVVNPEAISPQPASTQAWGDIDYNAPLHEKNARTIHEDTAATAQNARSFFGFTNTGEKYFRNKIWAPLPGTKDEIHTLQILFSSAQLPMQNISGEQATEEKFKAMDGHSPVLLHIATHGFFLPYAGNKIKNADSGEALIMQQQNPMFRSGLILAGANAAWIGNNPLPGMEDGILTAYEIAQMNFTGTDLVVLSACETALGDLQSGEGVLGLQRAFKMAGVKQMILSLWKVPDKETTELMTAFYKKWLSGLPPRMALHDAQTAMKNKYAPFYWAAFVLVE